MSGLQWGLRWAMSGWRDHIEPPWEGIPGRKRRWPPPLRKAGLKHETPWSRLQPSEIKGRSCEGSSSFFFFSWLADLHLQHLRVIVSICEMSQPSILCEVWFVFHLWVYFVVEVFDVPVFFPPDFPLTRQESPHLNIWWWVQKFSNHHFRSSSASADLLWQHFGSQTSAAVV